MFLYYQQLLLTMRCYSDTELDYSNFAYLNLNGIVLRLFQAAK